MQRQQALVLRQLKQNWNRNDNKEKMKCENSSGSNDYILVIRKEPYQLLLLLCMNRVKILQKGVVDSASSLLKIVYITSMAFLLNFASPLLFCVVERLAFRFWTTCLEIWGLWGIFWLVHKWCCSIMYSCRVCLGNSIGKGLSYPINIINYFY